MFIQRVKAKVSTESVTEIGNGRDDSGRYTAELLGTSARVRQAGFTLLELVMVMTIIVVLASISTVAYQQLHLKAKETILAEDLKTMRRSIDQYIADREQLPQSLDDLVNAKYIDKIPVDPITNEADWDVEIGEDTFSINGGQGVVNVHSKAPGTTFDGVAYSDL